MCLQGHSDANYTQLLNNKLYQQELTANTAYCKNHTLAPLHRNCGVENIITETKDGNKISFVAWTTHFSS
jgi:hypothetical protein